MMAKKNDRERKTPQVARALRHSKIDRDTLTVVLDWRRQEIEAFESRSEHYKIGANRQKSEIWSNPLGNFLKLGEAYWVMVILDPHNRYQPSGFVPAKQPRIRVFRESDLVLSVACDLLFHRITKIVATSTIFAWIHRLKPEHRRILDLITVKEGQVKLQELIESQVSAETASYARAVVTEVGLATFREAVRTEKSRRTFASAARAAARGAVRQLGGTKKKRGS